LQDYDKAEKMLKKQIKQNPYVPNYMVDLGYLYKISEQLNKAEQQYNNAIKNLAADQMQVIDLANAFLARKEADYAITTYLTGRKLMGGAYPFNFDLAEIYASQNKMLEAIKEYLDILQINEMYAQNVQDALQNIVYSFGEGTKTELLKTEMLKLVQKYPDKIVYAEMLIWHFIQLKNFDMALIQVKALDKRNNESGERVMSLAELALSNQLYDVSIKAYEYVIEKGKGNYNYIEAKMGLVDVLNDKLTHSTSYTNQDVLNLQTQYISTLNELGKTAKTIKLIKGFAHLQAFYLDKIKEGIALLQEVLQIPGLSESNLAECKLELGDLMLLSGDVWESTLLYSQVEKAFKHDILGHEAKFRNARLSYYKGEFEWAQAQLDVLKAATSKLIANDAMDLALLISDNIALDSNFTPLMMYAHAELLAFQNKDSLALFTLDSILTQFPDRDIKDELYFSKAKIALKHGQYEQAADLFQKIMDVAPKGIYADDALFKLAELKQYKLTDAAKAMELYEKLMTEYSGSLYVAEARRQYRILRGDNVN
jgi:tetratricopeptide (TPR) repeat protein